MRPRRAIRTLLVFVLLGAVATVASSWAIHAVQFYRAKGARQQTVTYLTSVPWPVEHDLARLHGINPTARDGEPAVDVDHPVWDYVLSGDPWIGPGPSQPAIMDADRAWRKYRIYVADAPPLPDYPFPHTFFEIGRPRFGWRILHSHANIHSTAFLPPNHYSDEVLFVLHTGWPRPALACGAYHVQIVEDYPINVRSGSSAIGPKGVSALADQPKVSLAGGVELWRRRPVNLGLPFLLLTYHDPLDRFALPLLPLWPGFAINTVFYALMLLLAWRTLGTIRRAARRRRGRCAACGYERGGLDANAACPECGAGPDLSESSEATEPSQTAAYHPGP